MNQNTRVKVNDYGIGVIRYDEFKECPEDYQNYVIRILSIQAFAERCGACELGVQLKLAPDFKTRMSLAKITYDEANHAYLLYSILEQLGVTEQTALQIAEGNKLKQTRTESLEGVIAVGNEENQWIDLILNNMLMDRAGSFMVDNFIKSSFHPWAKACEKIYQDELWHKKFGLKEFEKYIDKNGISGLDNKFALWYTRALNFFGPPNVKSENVLREYGIKRKSNETLRKEYINDVYKLMCNLNLSQLIPQNISTDYPYIYMQL